ncbi:MAG: zinc-binding alcohol dehydrogenase family protein, partial [Mycobacteriales bacterium]
LVAGVWNMQATVLLDPGRLENVVVPEPRDPGPGEALVAVRRVGICGTDFHAYAGRQNFISYPRVLGHELAVEVVGLGSGVDNVVVGDQCAVLPYLSCGDCLACRMGKANCCERIDVLGVTIDGGMRERFVLPASALFCGPGLSLDQLALVETLGIGMHAVQRGAPTASDGVLVIGAGPIGLAVAQCVRSIVGNVVVTDVSAERLAFCERTMKIDTVVSGADAAREVTEINGGDLPTLVFDATGNKESMQNAFDLVGAGGRLVFVGHTTGEVSFANPPFHRRELDLRASRNALSADWTLVLDGISAGVLDALPWINRRYALGDISRDLPILAGDPGDLVKAMVSVGGDAP